MMKNILEQEGASALELVVRERPMLVFDFDGTLAPIVDVPADAAMRPSTRALMQLVALMYPCAVVSGRSRADLVPRLAGIPLQAIVGNHGAEAGCGPVDRELRRQVGEWARTLASALGCVRGIDVEDKGLSVAVHYRRAPFRAAARRAIHGAMELLDGARVFDGRAVVNAVPADAHDKGKAVSKLLARLGCSTALYVGDDTTDEDAFCNDRIAVGVRVGRTHLSAAKYYLPTQNCIDDLLRALVRAPRRAQGRGDAREHLERWIRANA